MERLHSRTDSHWTYPPPRSSSSNVYSIMSGGHPADMYVNGNGNGSSTRPASFPLASNSAASRTKRTRDDEIAPDAKVAPEPSVASSTEGKRRRTLVDAPRPTIPGVQARPGSSSSVGRQPAL
ncbi:hypothetical protein KEM55_008449 [Ascosphaera atra]|nr:hypothetical protein KEM55_008449 [Ascosphaera atra]